MQEPKQISDWQKGGLIPDTRETAGAWRKFSAFELAWLAILKELKEFGIHSSILLLLQKKMFSLKSEETDWTMIEYSFVICTLRGSDLYLEISKKGEILLDNTFSSKKNFTHSCLISINLNILLSKYNHLFPEGVSFKSLYAETFFLSSHEKILIQKIRERFSGTLKIKTNHIGGIELIEEISVCKVNPEDGIRKVVDSVSYGDIKICRSAGKTSAIEIREVTKITEENRIELKDMQK